MENTLLLSDTYNNTFRNHIKNKIEATGQKDVHFVNTWTYANSGTGNLHCVSQKIPFCRPEKGAK
jgi:hypothetical protein